MKLRYLLQILALLLPWFHAAGQSAGGPGWSFDRKVTPPSPGATQLGVFGSAPPNLNTGAVQTTVPLPEVKSRQLSLGVALNYHYTGLLVNELPSWVGLGWTLGVGGVITRTVQGLPDEQGNNRGYITEGWSWLGIRHLRKRLAGPIALNINGLPNTTRDRATQSLYEMLLAGEYDSEPDAYSIATPFYSGKIFLDSAGVVTCSPYADVRIAGDPGIGWTITTGDGTVYEYSTVELTRTEGDDPRTSPTAWYLSSITSADGTDEIRLEYGTTALPIPRPPSTVITQAYRQPGNVSCGLVQPDVTRTNQPPPTTSLITRYLTEIHTSTMHLLFRSDAQRADIASSGDLAGRKLTGIVYRDSLAHRVRGEYRFTHGYFDSGSPDPYTKRLRLDAVQEVGKPSFRFSYCTSVLGTGMPSRNSYAKDHWGFYNGQHANTTLLPTFPPSLAALYRHYTGANRMPNGQYARLGALEQVQYPTGGWTTFAYEPNSRTIACDLAALTANQFGGAAGLPTTRFTARATAGAPFPMNAFELAFAGTGTNPGPGTGGGPGQSARPTSNRQNVRATRIDAPHGFFLEDLQYAGITTKLSHDSQGQPICMIPSGTVKTYFYKVDTDSVTLLPRPICTVTYAHDFRPNNQLGCVTRINRDSCNAQKRQHFAAGSYYLIAEVPASDTGLSSEITAEITFGSVPVSPGGPSCYREQEVGGIRLRQATDRTSAGDTITKTYRYRVPAAGGWRSSGHVFVEPEYAYSRECQEMVVSASDLGKANWLEAGYHIGYSRVEVESSGKHAGTTVNHYLNSDGQGVNFRNLLVKTQALTQAGELVRETRNFYSPVLIMSSPGLRLTKMHDEMTTCGGAPCVRIARYWLEKRTYGTFWPQLTRTTEQLFGTAAGVGTKDSTMYTYLVAGPGSTTQPVRTVKPRGPGQQLIATTRYCGQYYPRTPTGTPTGTPVGAPAVGLAGLVRQHMISIPVERQRWLRTGTDSVVIGGDLTQFANLRPARVFALATASPVPAASFVSSFVSSTVQGGVFVQDSRYVERVSFPRYSALGSLLEQRVAAAPLSSYLWGHAETALLAEVRNAAYAAVAYTSFEPDATGRWRYDSLGQHFVGTSLTGRRGFGLNGRAATAVRRDQLPAGDYELQVWAHGTGVPVVSGGAAPPRHEEAAAAGGWRQHRYRVRVPANGAISVNSNGQYIWIDELRLFPVGAQMTSYTHDPLVGMTSQTDPAGRTTTYEYDGLGRLLRTRDEQGRILSQQQYQYARP